MRSYSTTAGRPVLTTPKAHQAREVPLPRFLRDLLTDRFASKEPDDLIFGSGKPLDINNFRARVFKPALVAAGIDHLRIHELRHTAASLAVSAGAKVNAVQRMLGHASAEMTLDVYAGLFDEDLDRLGNSLNEAFSKAQADILLTDEQDGNVIDFDSDGEEAS